jgi:membrane protein
MSDEPGVLKTQLRVFVQTAKKTQHDHGGDVAATIAFWAFFSIFPILIGILSLVGYFLESSQLQARIYEVISNLLPGSAGLVRNNLEGVVRYRGTMTWISIGGLIWTAGKGFGAITRAVNRALDAKRKHFYLLSGVRYSLMAIAVSILSITSIGITVAIEIVFEPSFLSRLGFDTVEVPRFQGRALSFVLVFLIFGLIYKLAPYIKVQWRRVLPGALLAATLFELGKAAFVLYLDHMAHFQAIYGSLSSIIVLLLWLYLSALILIFGAEYNIVSARARTKIRR